MAREIKNVAILGATRNVGAATLKAVLATGKFTVTAIVRPGSPHKFPSDVQTKEADLSSVDSLVAAFRGQDAVVNTTNIPDPATNIRVADAARAAGVYRFIPADFGQDPATCHGPDFPVFAFKAATLKHLKEITSKKEGGGDEMTWTVVINGPFLDWNMAIGFLGIDVPKKRVEVISGGDTPVYYTTLEGVGQATAGVLLHPAETANRPVFINSVVKTQNQLVALAQEALGSERWTVTHEDNKEKFAWAVAEMNKGNFDYPVIMHQIRRVVADPEVAKQPARYDNELLGVKSMSDEEVKEMMKKIAAQ
ncbi:putative isoflavone reductase family protein CipA [Xylariaceae sp. FL1651]|nr:putative isoflavone reductase family protein CipA [Xylariaceae sp. FL1651]